MCPDGLDHVADRYHADQLFPLQHRQVADIVVRHQRHEFSGRLLGGYVDHFLAHNFPDRRVLGGELLQRYIAGVIALRDDLDQLVCLEHGLRPDILFRHDFDGIVDEGVRCHSPVLVAVDFQNLTYGFHRLPHIAENRKGFFVRELVTALFLAFCHRLKKRKESQNDSRDVDTDQRISGPEIYVASTQLER